MQLQITPQSENKISDGDICVYFTKRKTKLQSRTRLRVYKWHLSTRKVEFDGNFIKFEYEYEKYR